MNRPPIEAPPRRPLRAFAFDPMFGRGRLNVLTIEVENETLRPGPAGNRVVVVDYDIARRTYYAPVDLDDPLVLMQSGLRRPRPTRASTSRWSTWSR